MVGNQCIFIPINYSPFTSSSTSSLCPLFPDFDMEGWLLWTTASGLPCQMLPVGFGIGMKSQNEGERGQALHPTFSPYFEALPLTIAVPPGDLSVYQRPPLKRRVLWSLFSPLTSLTLGAWWLPHTTKLSGCHNTPWLFPTPCQQVPVSWL